MELEPERGPAASTYRAQVRALCRKAKLPMPVPEYRFDDREPPRKWRFDFAWVQNRVTLEIDGGVWSRGRHTRGAGVLRDQEKRNEAECQGWHVLHCTPQTLGNPVLWDQLRRLLT